MIKTYLNNEFSEKWFNFILNNQEKCSACKKCIIQYNGCKFIPTFYIFLIH